MTLGVPADRARVDADGGGSVRMQFGDDFDLDADGWRAVALVALAGRLDDPDWPPEYPSKSAAGSGDERQLAVIAERLRLDRAAWHDLTVEALRIACTPEFERLELGLAHLLEQGHVLDEATLQRVKAETERTPMQHTTKAATAEATDRGEFTAIAAAWSIDRQKDQIIRGAFARTIARWRDSGKRIPLHWNHQGEASNVIGYVDPATMRETDAGLEVSGRLEIDTSDTAREAWRSMKRNSMSLSFGYAATRQRKRRDGINELHEIDLFEVSIVAAPANPDTRILALKSHDAEPRRAPSLDELREQEQALGLGDDEAERELWQQETLDGVRATLDESSAKAMQARAESTAREVGAIKVATFEC